MTGVRHFVSAPIPPMVSPVVGTEQRQIQNLKITVYLLRHHNTQIQNRRFVTNLRQHVLRKMLNLYPGTRTVEEVSGAL
jgi:hypothetical protein